MIDKISPLPSLPKRGRKNAKKIHSITGRVPILFLAIGIIVSLGMMTLLNAQEQAQSQPTDQPSAPSPDSAQPSTTTPVPPSGPPAPKPTPPIQLPPSPASAQPSTTTPAQPSGPSTSKPTPPVQAQPSPATSAPIPPSEPGGSSAQGRRPYAPQLPYNPALRTPTRTTQPPSLPTEAQPA